MADTNREPPAFPAGLFRKSAASLIRPVWGILCAALLLLAVSAILPSDFSRFSPYFLSAYLLAILPLLILIIRRSFKPLKNYLELVKTDGEDALLLLNRVLWLRNMLIVFAAAAVLLSVLSILEYPSVVRSYLITAVLAVSALYSIILKVPSATTELSLSQKRYRRVVYTGRAALFLAVFSALSGYIKLGWRIYLLILICVTGSSVFRFVQDYCEKLLSHLLHADDVAEKYKGSGQESSFSVLMFSKHRTGMVNLLRFFLRNIFFFTGLYIILITAGFTHADLAEAIHVALFRAGAVRVSFGVLFQIYITIVIAYVAGKTGKHLLLYYAFPKAGLDAGTSQVLSNVVFVAVIGTGIIAALLLAGVNFMALGVIGGGLAVGIGFGLQNITNNIISGIILFFERPINVGDVIDVGGTPGTVRQIGIRSTIITTFDNIAIIIPNSEFISGRVINWSWGDITMRIDIPVGVAYGSDIKTVKQSLFDVASRHNLVKNEPAPEVMFTEFADSSLNFSLRIWIKDLRQRKNIISDINYMIDHAFRTAEIEIPFPQSDVYIKSVPAQTEIREVDIDNPDPEKQNK